MDAFGGQLFPPPHVGANELEVEPEHRFPPRFVGWEPDGSGELIG
jgi:hypothetical protein